MKQLYVFVPINEYVRMIEDLEDYQDLIEADKRIKEETITHDEFWKQVL